MRAAATMTERPGEGASRSRASRRPGAGAVIWGSLALFAVILSLLAYRLGSSTAVTTAQTKPAVVRKIVKRRVVTTIVPGPGGSSVSAGPASTYEAATAAAPITTGAS